MSTPYLRLEDTGEVFELRGDITTVGRGDGVDVHLEEPSVSRLHAELVRRRPPRDPGETTAPNSLESRSN